MYFGEGFLEEFEVGGVFCFFVCGGDEFLFKCVFGWVCFVFVEDVEFFGLGFGGEFEGGDFVGWIVVCGVFGCVVVFFFVDY